MLLFLIFIPLSLLLYTVFFGRTGRFVQVLKFAAALDVLLGLSLLVLFDDLSYGVQFPIELPWLDNLGVSLLFGVDGLNILFIFLTKAIFSVGLVCAIDADLKGGSEESHQSEDGRTNIIFVLALHFSVLVSFLTYDFVLFYIFSELMLIPLFYFLKPDLELVNSHKLKKIILTRGLSSVALLVAIVFMMSFLASSNQGMSSSVLNLYETSIPFVASSWQSPQTLLFFLISFALLARGGLFPFHGFVVQTATRCHPAFSGLVVFASLPLFIYGFIRFLVPVYPEASSEWGWLVVLLGIFGMIYFSLLALIQKNSHKFLTYSFLAVFNLCLAGFMNLHASSAMGAQNLLLVFSLLLTPAFFLTELISEKKDLALKATNFGINLTKVLLLITCITFTFTPLSASFPGQLLLFKGFFAKSYFFAYFALIGWASVTVVVTVFVFKLFKSLQSTQGASQSNTAKIKFSCQKFILISPFILALALNLFCSDSLRGLTKKSISYWAQSYSFYKLPFYQNSESLK